jgi:hypothetical protein
MIEQLDKVITTYVLPLVQRHQWKMVASHSSSRGAVRDYAAGNLYIRISLDRGLFDIEVGPVHSNNDLRNVSFFKDLIEPPMNGRWNLSIEQQCDFIEKHWHWLNESLSNDKAAQTIRALDDNANSKK